MTTESELLRQHEQTYHAFVRAAFKIAGVIAVLLILMALFLA